MAKIIKVSPAITPNRVVNPFKTSGHSTNPFKYQNFEGNTLDPIITADVFKVNEVSKLKMVAASVVGSMAKMRSNIFEPITAFVTRTKDKMISAWDYAANTNFSYLKMFKSVNKRISSVGTNVTGTISKIGRNISDFRSGISSKIGVFGTDITEIGKIASEKWSTIISKHTKPGITSETPISELETMLKEALEGVAA